MTHTAIRVALVVALFAVTAATRRAGSRSSGKPIAFERVRVSEGHQQQWREDQKLACGSGPITITGPDGRTSAAVFSPDGALWIRAGERLPGPGG